MEEEWRGAIGKAEMVGVVVAPVGLGRVVLAEERGRNWRGGKGSW